MKSNTIIFTALEVLVCAVAIHRSAAIGNVPVRAYEYAAFRWAGRDNTHVIQPGGGVEFLGPVLRTVARPNRADERAFDIDVAINSLARKGW